MRKVSVFLFVLLIVSFAKGQSRILSLPEFIGIVKTYHPVAKQATLIVQGAEAGSLATKGNFDPFINVNSSRKTFDGTNYYDYFNPDIRIPLWYGIDINGGVENNTGERLDESVTAGRSSYIGVNIPLAKGLLMDRRRADVLQAKIFKDLSRQEQVIIINDLLYEAYVAYWEWNNHFCQYQLVSRTVSNNRERYDFIRNAALLGERPMIDTTEALAQLQNFIAQQAEAEMNFLKSGNRLSDFMWRSNDSAFQLTADIFPDTSYTSFNVTTVELPPLQPLLDSVALYHPKLKSFGFKIRSLDVERRYKFQQLLPKFDLKYNVLSKEYFNFKNFGSQYLDHNYRFGINISMPLFLREARGQYRQAKIKIQDTRLQQQQTELEIINKVKYYYNELTGYHRQVLAKELALANYRKLLEAETERFREGESSVFLVNARENKLLEESLKLTELKTKFFRSFQSVQWAGGQLR